MSQAPPSRTPLHGPFVHSLGCDREQRDKGHSGRNATDEIWVGGVYQHSALASKGHHISR